MATIQQYRNMLRVNRNRLDDELEIHAQMLEEIGRNAAAAEREVARLEAARDEAVGRFGRNYKSTDPKAAAATVANEAALDRACSAAESAVADAKQRSAEWAALAKAWYQRGFDIKALGELYVAQYFTIDSVGMAVKTQERAEVERTVSQFERMGEAAKAEPQARTRRRVGG